MKRKISCIVLALLLILSNATMAFATETAESYSTMSNQKLAEITGLTENELAEARVVYGADFNSVISDYLTRIVNVDYEERKSKPRVFADAETNTSYIANNARISDNHWEFMKETFKKGQILVTDDAAEIIHSFGHAAIMVSTTHTVEHLGKFTSDLSGYYDVSWWQAFDTMKSFNYSDTSTMTAAANYANTNLRNWQYNALSDRTSTSSVNCATLVWKAYNSQGVNIVDSTSGVVYPEEFDSSSKLSWVRSVGWNNVTW